MKIAKLVRSCRKAQGITQAELAETVGVGVRFVRELEASKPTLRMDKVNQVLWLFGYELGPVSSKSTEITGDNAVG